MRRENNRKYLLEKIDKKFPIWNDFCNEFNNLIDNDLIFSKLPAIVIKRLRNVKHTHSNQSLISLKKGLLIPVLLFWKIFIIKFECLYQKKIYKNASTFESIEKESFEYLFILNTKDHIIAAIPILQNLNKTRNILVVMFREMYVKYKDDFDTLDNTKILFFDYELKNLPINRYVEIVNESKKKYEIIKSYKMDGDLKDCIEMDSNFIKLHLQEELVQFHLFEQIFSTFDIKGVVSIIFTTAFEIAKNKNIPTFVLQHGIGGADLEDHPYMCDYKIVYDNITKNHLDKWLKNTVNIIALGSPRFEYLKEHLVLKKDIVAFNNKIGNSGNKKIITYLAGGYGTQKMYSALKDFIKALPSNVILIIKLHPRVNLNVFDLKGEMEKILKPKEFDHVIFIKDEVGFYEIMAYSDIIITHASTGMLESIAVDIPTIQVGYFTSYCYPDVYNLASYGWKDPINDPDILIKEVLSILSDNKKYESVIEKQKWLKNKVFKNFGSCGKVIADTIMEISE
ncbi:MAG: hypothetical protein E4G94_00125 [ANME-2 cluster archaeon]|nr:MAG: hypothetical protein E4G94_00125 [ANME-2 cluster archaeon]